jgi:hypothetical protein
MHKTQTEGVILLSNNKSPLGRAFNHGSPQPVPTLHRGSFAVDIIQNSRSKVKMMSSFLAIRCDLNNTNTASLILPLKTLSDVNLILIRPHYRPGFLSGGIGICWM